MLYKNNKLPNKFIENCSNIKYVNKSNEKFFKNTLYI